MEKKAPGKASPQFLRKWLMPLLKERSIEAIYVYGSSISGKSPGDIDVMVIVNDTRGLNESVIPSVESMCVRIRTEAEKNGLRFHFQPAKTLSRWWHLLIEGEPWVISSLKEPAIVYDRKGIVREVCSFISKEHLCNKEEKAEKLIERSDTIALMNRQLLLGAISNLANAGTEAAQILLLFDGKFILNKRAIAQELERNYQKILGTETVGSYREIIDLEEKVSRGTLSEFSAENLDYYLEKISVFISQVESMLGGK